MNKFNSIRTILPPEKISLGIPPRVFVVQQPVKMIGGEWKTIFDIKPAASFGKLVFVLAKPGNIYLDVLANVLDHMRNVLHDFGDEDFILPTGEPVAIAAAALIAGTANQGRVKVLKWNRVKRAYEIVQLTTGVRP